MQVPFDVVTSEVPWIEQFAVPALTIAYEKVPVPEPPVAVSGRLTPAMADVDVTVTAPDCAMRLMVTTVSGDVDDS